MATMDAPAAGIEPEADATAGDEPVDGDAVGDDAPVGHRHVTTTMLIKATPTRRARGEPLGKLLKRLTHLNLNGCGLTGVDHLEACENLRVLYLYDNSLTTVAGLAPATRLTHLYLQNNHLTDTSGLSPLVNLTKLYLDDNRLSRVVGLGGMTQLEELHLSNQGTAVTLDDDSLRACQQSLRVLNVAGNRLVTLETLALMRRLETLNVSNNAVEDFGEVCTLFRGLRLLRSLDMRGNPCCSTPKYQEKSIMLSPAALETMDDKPVDPKQREFLLRLEMRKRKGTRPPAGGGAGAGGPTRGRALAGAGAAIATAARPHVPHDVTHGSGGGWRGKPAGGGASRGGGRGRGRGGRGGVTSTSRRQPAASGPHHSFSMPAPGGRPLVSEAAPARRPAARRSGSGARVGSGGSSRSVGSSSGGGGAAGGAGVVGFGVSGTHVHR